MTLDEFQDGLDAYGADLSDWPEDQVAAARGLLDRSSAARAALAQAESLDAGLDALLATPVAAPSGLADRIMLRAEIAPTDAEILPFPRRAATPAPQLPAKAGWWPPQRATVVAFAAMVVCFVGGILTVQTVFPATSATESLYVSGVYSDLGW